MYYANKIIYFCVLGILENALSMSGLAIVEVWLYCVYNAHLATWGRKSSLISDLINRDLFFLCNENSRDRSSELLLCLHDVTDEPILFSFC